MSSDTGPLFPGPSLHPWSARRAGDVNGRAMTACVLVGRPIKAPILFADEDTIPDATKAALDGLQPTGSKGLGGAQVIRVGTKAPVEGYKTTDVEADNPAALAAAVDRVRTS